MGIYTGAGSAAHQTEKLYAGINGTARQVQKVYAGVDGKAKLVYTCGSAISGRSIGSVVKIRVNGAGREFIIVQQGLPGSDYDASCSGVWLLQRYVYDTVSYNKDFYENSNTHAYMNNTFFPQLEPGVQSIVKRVKIPFRDNKGANGLDTRAFALAAVETGKSISDTDSGAALAYFAAGNSATATYENGSAAAWWTRSRYTNFLWGNEMYYITESGDVNEGKGKCAVRPCIIVPFETLVDEDGYIVA